MWILEGMVHKCSDLIPHTLHLRPSNLTESSEQAINLDIENLLYSKDAYVNVIQELFLGVSKYYPETEHLAEYIARIPQAILILAHKYHLTSGQIEKSLKNCLPHLYDYYSKDFLPACEKYIQDSTKE